MSNKKKAKYIILEICLAVLLMIIALSVCLIVLSKKNNDNSSSESSLSLPSSSSSESSFIPEASYNISLKVGETCSAELTDIDTESKLIWLSSDSDIASVDDFGTITGISPGSCTVTVIIIDTDQNIVVNVNVT